MGKPKNKDEERKMFAAYEAGKNASPPTPSV